MEQDAAIMPLIISVHIIKIGNTGNVYPKIF